MFLEITKTLLPLILSFVGLVIFFAYIFISTPTRFSFKFIGIPLLFLAVYLSIIFMVNILGRAHHSYPPDKFTLISYIILPSKTKSSRYIQIWVRLKDESTRLFQIPYSRPIEKELQKARKREQRTGRMQQGKWSIKQGSHEQIRLEMRNSPHHPRYNKR